jgi:selenide, water dikinase
VRFADLPIIDEARQWAEQGTVTGATGRNWSGYGSEVRLPAGAPDWQRALLTDPQTSGGLLVACDPAASAKVLEIFRAEGFEHAAIVGEIVAGAPEVTVA